MTPVQTWDALCSYIFQLYPDCIVKRQYKPIEDLEKLAQSTRPTLWVGLSNVSIGSVTTNATIVEDVYNFQITMAWKLHSKEDQMELDERLNDVQSFLTIFRHKAIEAGNSRLYFGLPSCDSPYEEDLLLSPGIYLAVCTIPVTVYRDLNHKVIVNNGSNDSNESSAEETTAGDQTD